MKKQSFNLRKLILVSALLSIAGSSSAALAATKACSDLFRFKSNAFLMKSATDSNLPAKSRRLSDFADPSQLIGQVVRFEAWGTDYRIEDIQLVGNQFQLQARTADSSAKALTTFVDQGTSVFPGAVREKQLDENGNPRFMSNYLGQMVTLRISSERNNSNSLQVVHAVQGQVIFQDDQRMQILRTDDEVVSVDLRKSPRIEVVEWRFWGPTQERRNN